ncbi:MAG TPA: hypothetical protein VNG69_03420 [Casimicrobiaceae bacterium]|nr:hypothetical protein [Casimicrobiaceae bacterium]
MLLTFDVEEAAIAEHDDWHTHEHLPERLSIPGFLRGTRWVAVQGSPRYAVIYEVERLETLRSEAYLTRLNNPTPWTSKMMTHYRGMIRGLCSVERSYGLGSGHYSLLIRFKPAAESAALIERLDEQVLRHLPLRPGLGSVHLLRGALAAAMTSEQQIRGVDAGVDWALMATGYEPEAVADLTSAELSLNELEAHGCATASLALYRADYSLSADEVDA